MVADAREVTAEIPLGDDPGDVVTCVIPDADAINTIYQKRAEGDLYGALGVLLGEDNLAKLREVALAAAGEDGRVPITVWRDLIQDTMRDLGLEGSPER